MPWARLVNLSTIDIPLIIAYFYIKSKLKFIFCIMWLIFYNLRMILGIDEAGRGPWAGPLVVGAVVLGDAKIDGLTDSKKLTKKKRELLYGQIVRSSASYATGWVDAAELDELGMSQALKVATIRAVEQIDVAYNQIIIDGTVNFLKDTGKGKYVTTLAKADLLISSVSAASIIAKVERDLFMEAQDEFYPGYGFASHSGYGTAKHRAAIEQFGICELHRLSFAPLKRYAGAVGAPKENFTKTTKQIGDAAETVVVQELENRGHQIISRNWRTKFCEIDIVSFFEDTVYFTEVKYRKNADYGDGLAVITAKKQRQMKFAAELFLAKYKKFSAFKAQLLAVAVEGEPPEIKEFIEI